LVFGLLLILPPAMHASAGPVPGLRYSRAGELIPQRLHGLDRTARYLWLRSRATLAGGIGHVIGAAELLGIHKWPKRAYQDPVSPILTRGSQVDAEGVKVLRQKNFRSIISLARETQIDRAPARAQGLNYLYLPMLDNTAPSSYAPVKQMLEFLSRPENQPAYIHCKAGIGRTGVMVAAYRMAYEGAPVGQALVEARSYGLSLRAQVLFIRRLGRDLEAIRDQQARGLLPPGPAWQLLPG
jgi:hypothetical protein